MRRASAVVAVLFVLGLAGATEGQNGATRDVTMPGKVYAPRKLDILVGDTVVWRNADIGNHTVTAEDDSFDSGPVAAGRTFSRRFDQADSVTYFCAIHPSMRGEIRVRG
jgi:plastocyanin